MTVQITFDILLLIYFGIAAARYHGKVHYHGEVHYHGKVQRKKDREESYESEIVAYA